MFLERLIYCVLCISLAVYMAKKCLNEKRKLEIVLLGLMLIGLMVEIITFVTNIYPDWLLFAFRWK